MWKTHRIYSVLVFLYHSHAAGRVNGKSVIININVNFASQYQIITVDKRIDKCFKYTSLTLFFGMDIERDDLLYFLLQSVKFRGGEEFAQCNLESVTKLFDCDGSGILAFPV